MAIDPEALQRAMRAQFPAPELAPEASDWMREIVAPIGSNPFVRTERDVLITSIRKSVGLLSPLVGASLAHALNGDRCSGRVFSYSSTERFTRPLAAKSSRK